MRYIRWTLNPTAVPRPIGSRMEAAGWAKTAGGNVKEGMKVVMAAILNLFLLVKTQLSITKDRSGREMNERCWGLGQVED